MIRLKLSRALALALFAAAALPAHAGEVYQISTISSLLAGAYDGDTTVAELLRHGGFGLGTFNGVDGEMMVLDGLIALLIKARQVVHTFEDVDGILIGFRFPAATTSVNVPGWHFHFLSADRSRGGHVLGLTTGAGLALLEECSELRISLPARAPASSAGADAIRAVERPQ